MTLAGIRDHKPTRQFFIPHILAICVMLRLNVGCWMEILPRVCLILSLRHDGCALNGTRK